MSLLDELKADTIGVAYRAWTGNVDPYTKAIQREATDAAIAKAGSGMSPEQVRAVQDQAHKEQDSILNMNDANPTNPDGSVKGTVRIPGLGVVGSAEFLQKMETVVSVVAGGLALGIAGYGFLKLGGIAFVKKTVKEIKK